MTDDEPHTPNELPDGIGQAADPAAFKKQSEKAVDDRLEGDRWWAGLIASKVGRHEIWALLTSCHSFEERFACGPNGAPQPEATWYQAGERDTGLRLYRSLLRIDHEAVHRMHLENDPEFAAVPAKRRGKAVQ